MIKGKLSYSEVLVQWDLKKNCSSEPGLVEKLVAKRAPADRSTLEVTWKRPNQTNGVILKYDVMVVGLRGLKNVSLTTSCSPNCSLQCPAHDPDPDPFVVVCSLLVFRDTNCFVNPVSAVGPVIERSLIRNPD
jgi:hypothetical protein